MLKRNPNPARCVSLPAIARRGFSLIELVMIIGILMILIGLVLPAIGRSMAAGRQTRVLAAIQQAAALTEMYCTAYRDTYPLPEADLLLTSLWPENMVRAGLLLRSEDADPDGFKRYGRLNIGLSKCMFYDHNRMHPGRTEPEEQQRPSPVRSTDVTFPSLKGLFRTITVNDGKIETLWCCVEGVPKGPVAFADGSASVQYWKDLLPKSGLYFENGIGLPVSSTWGGVRGRDKQ